jgi:basic membrane lipoprotein Med (substrate-binding protein (PBP1-ABC) superfamily)
MAKIVLLSCTKSKLDKRSKAKDLYSASPMFKKTLEYGEELNPDKMFILSAKHHLVPLNKMLEPYDKTLKEMPKDEKEKWGEEVFKQMKQNGVKPEQDKFIMLTGSEYTKPLMKYIPEKNIEQTMEGKRFGQRLKWLNSQLNKIKEVLKRVKNIIYEIIQTPTKRVY